MLLLLLLVQDSMLPLFPSPEQARFYQPRTVPE
jgi:hypothetical protein